MKSLILFLCVNGFGRSGGPTGIPPYVYVSTVIASPGEMVRRGGKTTVTVTAGKSPDCKSASVGLAVNLHATSGLIFKPPASSHGPASFGRGNVASLSFEVETPESNPAAGTIYADGLIYSGSCELMGEPKQITIKVN